MAEKNKHRSSEHKETEEQHSLDSVEIDEEDLEAQMTAALAADELTHISDDDLETKMTTALAAEVDEETDDNDIETHMAAKIPVAAKGKVPGSLLDELADEDGDMDENSKMSVRPLKFQQLRPSDERIEKESIDRLFDVILNISVELGRKQMQIKDILDLGPGKIIELDKLAGEPVDLLVNGKLLARGEVVVVDENFGVRITDLIDPKERIRSL